MGKKIQFVLDATEKILEGKVDSVKVKSGNLIFEKDGEMLSVIHFGTLILELNLNEILRSPRGLVFWKITSITDANYIYTILSIFTNKFQAGYKPINGGGYLTAKENGQTILL